MVELSRHKAFAEYVLPEVEVLYRVARTVTEQPMDAEELVQETLVRALRSIDQIDGRQPKAWLLTILRDLDRRRRGGDVAVPTSGARVPVTTPETHEPTGAPDAEAADPEVDAQIGTVFDVKVEQAFAALPGKYRRVVDLVDIEGLDHAAAAAALGISVATVMHRLHRARDRIRRELAAEGIVPKRGGE